MKAIVLSAVALGLMSASAWAATPEEPVCEVERTVNLMLAKAK
ncbi:hypothetical protein [Sulfuriferula sp.]|nr:hypothetical protein [Sulfuriferula sp.]MDP2026279.1 hypothetical protein [Sulfuriferula sp.]